MSQNGGFGFTHFVDEDEAGNVPDIGRSYPDLQLQPHLEQEVYSERPKEGSTVVEPVTNHGSSTACTAETSYKGIIESTEHGVINRAQIPSVINFQHRSREGNVWQLQLVTRADGSRYIAPKGVSLHRSRPSLNPQRIKYLKTSSIIACIAFFPLGIFAAYFAFRIEKEFNDGIMNGNIDRAIKFAKLAIRLTYASFSFFISVVTLVVTIFILLST